MEPLEPPPSARAEDTPRADNSITISWDVSPTPGVQYRIYRYKYDTTTKIATPESLQPITINQLTYIDTRSVVDGQTYIYRIVALKGTEESENYAETNEVTPVKDASSGTP